MKVIISLNIFLLIMVFSTAAQPVKLYIDPRNALGGSVSEILDQVDYIPLETTKESIFGEIGQLAVTDKYFIILDRYTNTILLFTKEGRFHAKISGGKRSILEFSYHSEKQTIRVKFFDRNSLVANPENIAFAQKNPFSFYSKWNNYIMTSEYSLDGKHKGNINYNGRAGIFGASPIQMGKTHFAVYDKLSNSRFPDSVSNQLNVFKGDKLVKGYFPYNLRKDIATCGELAGVARGGGLFGTVNDSIYYFTHPFDYTVYELSPNSVLPVYKMIFPLENSIPQAYFLDTTSSEDQRASYLKKHPDYITSIPSVHKAEGILFASVRYSSYSVANLIYSLTSGSVYDFSKVNPDALNYYLPISKQTNEDIFSSFEDESFYFGISSLDMFNAKEANASKMPPYPEVLNNYFRRETRKSNPVIVRLKVKENL